MTSGEFQFIMYYSVQHFRSRVKEELLRKVPSLLLSGFSFSLSSVSAEKLSCPCRPSGRVRLAQQYSACSAPLFRPHRKLSKISSLRLLQAPSSHLVRAAEILILTHFCTQMLLTNRCYYNNNIVTEVSLQFVGIHPV